LLIIEVDNENNVDNKINEISIFACCFNTIIWYLNFIKYIGNMLHNFRLFDYLDFYLIHHIYNFFFQLKQFRIKLLIFMLILNCNILIIMYLIFNLILYVNDRIFSFYNNGNSITSNNHTNEHNIR